MAREMGWLVERSAIRGWTLKSTRRVAMSVREREDRKEGREWKRKRNREREREHGRIYVPRWIPTGPHIARTRTCVRARTPYTHEGPPHKRGTVYRKILARCGWLQLVPKELYKSWEHMAATFFSRARFVQRYTCRAAGPFKAARTYASTSQSFCGTDRYRVSFCLTGKPETYIRVWERQCRCRNSESHNRMHSVFRQSSHGEIFVHAALNIWLLHAVM